MGRLSDVWARRPFFALAITGHVAICAFLYALHSDRLNDTRCCGDMQKSQYTMYAVCFAWGCANSCVNPSLQALTGQIWSSEEENVAANSVYIYKDPSRSPRVLCIPGVISAVHPVVNLGAGDILRRGRGGGSELCAHRRAVDEFPARDDRGYGAGGGRQPGGAGRFLLCDRRGARRGEETSAAGSAGRGGGGHGGDSAAD